MKPSRMAPAPSRSILRWCSPTTSCPRCANACSPRCAPPTSWCAAPMAWASTISPTASGAAASRRASTLRGGNVAYISHSGSGMCGIVDTDERIDFNYVVSTGQELTVSMDQYLDFVIDQPSTRVVGLFMETARHPA